MNEPRPPSTDEIKALHTHYCAITGLDVPYTMNAHFAWESWVLRGFKSADIDMVVHYIRTRMKKRRREAESLLFRNLIANPDHFGEDLAMAKYQARIRPDNPDRVSVLRSTGRAPAMATQARSARDIIQEHATMAALLAEWKKDALK